MSTSESDAENTGHFPKTSVTLHQAIMSPSPDESRQALERFFNIYWYPMYVFMRAQGESHHDASDLVQDFILKQLLSNQQLENWNPERGKLRTFLKTILDRFRMKEYRKDSALKRGGPKGKTHVSMDFDWAEGQFQNTAVNWDSPDKIFDQEWAGALVQQAIANLAESYAAKDKLEEFQLLMRNLDERAGGPNKITYEKIAAALNTSENNVKQKMRELRTKFRQTIASVVGETVTPEDFDDELKFIFDVSM